MATPQGWEEIMPTCKCKNPPIHKPLMMCIGFYYFIFFHICNVAELAFIRNTVQPKLKIPSHFGYMLEPNREIWPIF